MTVPRDLVLSHTRAILDVLEEFRPGCRAALSADPLTTIATWPDVALQYVEGVGAGAPCEVAGAYLGSAVPPVLQIASATRARMAFTSLHELGHHLQQTDGNLVRHLLVQDGGGQVLEEAACDEFAAQILIPAATVDACLVDGVSASAVVALWETTTASRSAVCVAAARHLPAPGHVTLLDPRGIVVFDAAHGEPRLRRGSDQSATPVVTSALRTGSARAQETGRFAYRDGIQGRELYMQAAEIGDYIVVVSVTDKAPWLKFSPTLVEDRPRARWHDCEHCEHAFEVWHGSCPRCGVPVCPECGRCNCIVAQRLCLGCFLKLPLAAFEGESERCVSCT